jgi:hypothetical protein
MDTIGWCRALAREAKLARWSRGQESGYLHHWLRGWMTGWWSARYGEGTWVRCAFINQPTRLENDVGRGREKKRERGRERGREGGRERERGREGRVRDEYRNH